MPYGNGTGPWGRGRMSGRGAGYCAGNDQPGYANPGMGRGRGPNRNFGRGYSRGPGYGPAFEPPDYPRTVPIYREPSPEEEKAFLENLVKDLEAELADVKARMNELVKEK